MLTTDLTERLEIDHPIIQAGMGGGAGSELAAAVSNAGALGTVGTIARTPDDVSAQIDATRRATDRPFAVNVVAFDWAPNASDVLAAVIDARPPVVTLSFGDAAQHAATCREAGLTTIVQVQDLTGLHASVEAGADAIVVQGTEAGGHTGRRGTLSFVAQALDLAEDVPIVAAGGIGDGRGLAAALAMGCAGAVMGTRFKASAEFVEDAELKDEIVRSDGSNTVYDVIVDVALGGRWPNDVTGRILHNAFVDEWSGREHELAAKVAEYDQFGFAMELAAKGQHLNWAGESSALVKEVQPAAEIVEQTVRQATELLARASERYG
jgi:nitronate monooxygenase